MQVYITFRNEERESREIYGVRAISVYPHSGDDVSPEAVLHFHELKPQENIALSDIQCITIMEK